MNTILKNWKTTLTGVATFVIAGLTAIGKLSPEQGAEIMGGLVAAGLIAAKDGSVTK